MIPVPVLAYSKATGANEESTMEVPVMNVAKLLSYLHHEVGLQCPIETIEEYWDHLQSVNMPFANLHPGRRQHVPYSIYGDECCIGQDPHDKCTAIFLSLTLFRPKSVRQGQFLLCALPEDIIIHDEMKTLYPILEFIVRCANQAFDGIDTAGPCFACCEIKGRGLEMAGKMVKTTVYSCLEDSVLLM